MQGELWLQVEPFSVAHKYSDSGNSTEKRLVTCNAATMKAVTAADDKQEVQEGAHLMFTYDVIFTVRLGLTRALVES
jgi:hypothetical protein